jgi:hypothetical protein
MDGAHDMIGHHVLTAAFLPQFGGSPIKVGDEEFSLFRDHE